MNLPNVIIAGAPKCGTSSLYFWLAAHPDTCASKAKETFFFADDINRFNQNCNFIQHGLHAYQKHFSHCKGSKVVFEATAPYMYYETALREISKLETKPKVIFILREPTKRLMSQYLFEKYRTGTKKKISIEEYIKLPGIIKHGMYSSYLQKWIEQLGTDRVKVYIFEEFMGDVKSGMKQLATDINISASFYENMDFVTRNETLKMKSTWLHQLGLKVQAKIPHALQNLLLPLYLKLNSGGKPMATELEKSFLTKELKSIYLHEKQTLEKLLGREIKLW